MIVPVEVPVKSPRTSRKIKLHCDLGNNSVQQVQISENGA